MPKRSKSLRKPAPVGNALTPQLLHVAETSLMLLVSHASEKGGVVEIDRDAFLRIRTELEAVLCAGMTQKKAHRFRAQMARLAGREPQRFFGMPEFAAHPGEWNVQADAHGTPINIVDRKEAVICELHGAAKARHAIARLILAAPLLAETAQQASLALHLATNLKQARAIKGILSDAAQTAAKPEKENRFIAKTASGGLSLDIGAAVNVDLAFAAAAIVDIVSELLPDDTEAMTLANKIGAAYGQWADGNLSATSIFHYVDIGKALIERATEQYREDISKVVAAFNRTLGESLEADESGSEG